MYNGRKFDIKCFITILSGSKERQHYKVVEALQYQLFWNMLQILNFNMDSY